LILVLIEKDVVLEGSTTKIEDKRAPGRYTSIVYTCTASKSYGEGVLGIFDRFQLWGALVMWTHDSPKLGICYTP